MKSNRVLDPFSLCAFAVVLSTSWLLPNHYPPWSSFHMDAWAATVLSVLAITVIVRSPPVTAWSGTALLTAALVVLIFVQYLVGTISFAGTAWISVAYLLGFLLALIIGAKWESASPGQLADGLFLAVGMASIVSVGLQLYQWLLLDGLDIWSMGAGLGRPFANFGQPNQLGTFLLWGLVAIAWAVTRQKIHAVTALLAALFLLFGLALTASRTAWIGLAILIGASWYWRRLWTSRWVPIATTLLGFYFVICSASIEFLSDLLYLPSINPFDYSRLQPGIRPLIWTLLSNASLEHPLWGYGWNQVVAAQLSQVEKYPALNLTVAHGHNLFLDLAIWCGLPISIAVSFFILYWLWRGFIGANTVEKALLMLFLIVTINHAMFEFPLHHAYILLPVGLVIGAVDSKGAYAPVFRTGRALVIFLWLLSIALLMGIVRDYLLIERSYQQLRFAQANPQVFTAPANPNVVLLTQWREFIRFTKFEPSAAMSDADIDWMRKLTLLYPSTGFSQKLATGLALKGQHSEAKTWLQRACKVSSNTQCTALKTAWANQAAHNQDIAAVGWVD